MRYRRVAGCWWVVFLVSMVLASQPSAAAEPPQSAPDAAIPLTTTDWAAIQDLLPFEQQVYFKASNVSADDKFGESVAVSGNTVVVGAPFERSSIIGVQNTATPIVNTALKDAGAAYVFVREGTTWRQQAYLKASQVSAEDHFGLSVAVSGNTIIVGAPSERSGIPGVQNTATPTVDETPWMAGAAYVFVREGTTWRQQAYLKASHLSGDDRFGESVAVSGETIVVGTPNERSGIPGVQNTATPTVDTALKDAGAAYVFVRTGTTWRQQAYLKASQVSAYDWFGWSVAVSGDTIVVGTPNERSGIPGVQNTATPTIDDNQWYSGAAYVFVRTGTTWSQQAYLKASHITTVAQFGRSVAVSGDTIVVGVPAESSSTVGVQNTATPIVDHNALNAGAAYVFVRTGTTWSQQAYLKSSHNAAQNRFGWSVAVSGDTIVVGVPFEVTSGIGIPRTGTPTVNPNVACAGAVYVFIRAGTTWSQHAYLQASSLGESEYFGIGLAISGDTIIVGAPQERSSITGVQNTATPTIDHNATNAGAVYGFTWQTRPMLPYVQYAPMAIRHSVGGIPRVVHN